MYQGWSALDAEWARHVGKACAQGARVCAGREHPEPKYILSIAIHNDTMYALSFTEGIMAASGAAVDTAADAALAPGGAEAHSTRESVAVSFDDRAAAEGSLLEIHALDLQKWRWSKVDAQVCRYPQAAAIHRIARIVRVVIGHVRRPHPCAQELRSQHMLSYWAGMNYSCIIDELQQ